MVTSGIPKDRLLMVHICAFLGSINQGEKEEKEEKEES
jgi:hypothetical protein